MTSSGSFTGHERLKVSLDDFPNLKRWDDVLRAARRRQEVAVGRGLRSPRLAEDDAKMWLFGQKLQT